MKPQLKLLLLFLLLMLVFVVSTALRSVQNQENEPPSDGIVRIKIVGMTDLHGNFQMFDFVRRRPVVGGMPYIHQFVKQERKDTTQHVILLDGGDVLQGQMVVFYYNYVDEREFYMPAFRFNRAGVDAGVVGNHDLEAGKTVLERFTSELYSPLLGANVVYTQTQEPYFQPYTILERGGIRIAVLGLTTPIQTDCMTLEIIEGLEVTNMLEPARYWMNHIRQNESPDLIIGLFHAGFPNEADSLHANEACFYENNPVYIAENVPGFDALLLGHLHRSVIHRTASYAGDSVWLIEPGFGGRNVAVLDFELQKIPGQKAKILSSSARIENVFESQNLLLPETILEIIDECELMALVADEPVALLMDSICNVEAFFGSSFFVDLVHKVQLEHTGAEISFASPLSTNVVIRAGFLTFSDLFRVYRFENTLTVLHMTGKEIKDYLEYSYDLWINQMRSPYDRMLRTKELPSGASRYLGREFEIPQYYFDSGAGLDYEVDVRKPFGQRIQILRMSNGDDFEKNRMYQVVTCTYRVAGAGGHMEQGAKIDRKTMPYRIISADNTMVRELIREDFIRQGEVKAFRFDNWRFVPESYTKPAKAREIRELQ